MLIKRSLLLEITIFLIFLLILMEEEVQHRSQDLLSHREKKKKIQWLCWNRTNLWIQVVNVEGFGFRKRKRREWSSNR